MRGSYIIALVVTLMIAGTYWYKSSASMCPAPLSYRVGNIDKSFSLSLKDAREYALRAETIWEEEVNRELFVYDESSDFTIDFVFDERQATANSEERQRQELDAQREKNEEVLHTVESLQKDYEELSAQYKSRVAEYEIELAAYNTEVNRYNDRGGAPPDEFEKLEVKRIELSQEVSALSKLTKQLNDLAKKINRLGERGNSLVNEYNEEVNQYNTEFGFAREFTQGDYQGASIHIYKFSSDNELVTVLSHEFGHALGIDHVDGTSSLMYYLLEETDQPPVLVEDDLAAYYAVCGVKESAGQVVRRNIRDFFTNFKYLLSYDK